MQAKGKSAVVETVAWGCNHNTKYFSNFWGIVFFFVFFCFLEQEPYDYSILVLLVPEVKFHKRFKTDQCHGNSSESFDSAKENSPVTLLLRSNPPGFTSP